MTETVCDDPNRLIPYPGATTRWDYAAATLASEALMAADGNTETSAAVLTNYIFGTHPDVLDLPPAVLYRYREAERVIARFDGGSEQLQSKIFGHYHEAGQQLADGYTYAATATLTRANSQHPDFAMIGGTPVQRITLPDAVARRGLAWNHWAQQQIVNGNIDRLFGGHPEWVATKLADGTWLQAGNLMMEVADGLGRVRTPVHQAHNVENQWGLTAADSGWGSGLDQWFVMSHIMDKELLVMADALGDDMIDGMKLLPATYARSYVAILELMNLNPQLDIKGVLSDGTWAYSAELGRLFPYQHVSQLHGLVGKVIELGTADELDMPAQRDFATHNQARMAAYMRGDYHVGIAARFIDRSGMQTVVQRFDVAR